MKAIERALSLLDSLAAAGSPRGVTELARDLRLSKSNVHRSLCALEGAQWVIQDRETGRYRIGNKVLEIGLSFLSNLDLRIASLPYLKQLRDATAETACLSLRIGLERMFVDQIQGDHEVRLVVDLGKRLPMWSGTTGKAMLAYLTEGGIATVIDNLRGSGPQVLASGKVLDVGRLMEELAEARNRGFAVTSGERLLGATGVAAPIFGHDHGVVGAISVGGVLPRFTPERATSCGPLVAQAARAISSHLGDSDRYAEGAR